MHSVAGNLNETYEASPRSVAEGRAQLADFAAKAGATLSQIDAVRLAASEAMTNSVLHAYRCGPGLIYVNAAVASGELWILISDDGSGLKPRADRPGLGLGLGLISEVSDDFAITLLIHHLSQASGQRQHPSAKLIRERQNLAIPSVAPAPGEHKHADR